MTRIQLIPFALALFLSTSSAASSHQCYYPNGDASTDTPCYADTNYATGGQSFCCAKGYACLANQICLSVNDTSGNPKWNRGGCTDKSWGSGGCPQFCLDNHANGGSWVIDCGMINSNDPSAGNVGCCTNSSSTACCSDDSKRFTISGVASSTITIVGAAATEGSTTATTTSESSITSAASTTPGSATTTSGVPTTTATPTSQPSSSDSSSGISGGAIAGIVVGIVAGVTLAVFLVRRNRARKASAGGPEAAEMPPSYKYGGHLPPAGYTEDAKFAPIEAPNDQKPVELEAPGPVEHYLPEAGPVGYK